MFIFHIDDKNSYFNGPFIDDMMIYILNIDDLPIEN
jgi:hypothetical protein